MYTGTFIRLPITYCIINTFMHTMLFPQISPVAFSVFSFDIYWYSFAYIIGLFGGYTIVKYHNKTEEFFLQKSLDDLLFYAILGVILGARVGFCLIYDLEKSISNPISILQIRNGGMSFHGGFVGLVCAIFYISQKYKLSFLKIGDFIALVAPLGIMLGRIGNFFNQEHLGKLTDVPWAVIFPLDPMNPRHPAQLYEAFLEGFLLLILLNFFYNKLKLQKKHGIVSALFLILYGLARIISEIFREPDYMIGVLSIGQMLSIPMIIAGLSIIYFRQK